MDSTMIDQECIDELAETAGVGDRVRAITARAMNGELDFEGALTERVRLLEGLDAAVIARVLDRQITYASGGATLVATMKAHGAYAALVSGGFTAFTGPVAARSASTKPRQYASDRGGPPDRRGRTADPGPRRQGHGA
jgi:phosphoserine phosphatase